MTQYYPYHAMFIHYCVSMILGKLLQVVLNFSDSQNGKTAVDDLPMFGNRCAVCSTMVQYK